MAVERRSFILVLGAVFGAAEARLFGQGLEQFSMSEPPCTDDPRLTPAVPLDATFRPGAPAKADLVEAGMTGQKLSLSGTVAGIKCGRVAGARVDLWQADAAGVYDMRGFRLRGHQLTDASGHFTFRTVIPGAAGGRVPHVGLRVQVPGKADLTTELFFPDDPRNAADSRFRQELVLKMVGASAGRAAVVDVVLNL